jgi:predicted  nucleic acid-binding Zn-ribbon protein
MIDFLAVYSEAGMIGVVGAMFVYLVISLSQKSAKQQESLEDLRIENKGQSETLENMEGMIIKLIDRWNKSDETRDRRHEDMVKEVNDLSDVMMEVKGSVSRINGRK